LSVNRALYAYGGLVEELAEVTIKPILRAIRFILIEAICEFLIYWVGRIFLLVVTLGNYPRGRQVEEHEGRIIFTGIVVIILSIFLISIYV
jgi:phage baseplate assembly protein W